MTERALQLQGITKRFGDFTAVSGLDLTVPKGSCYGFLGPNGAGKTTTIRIILSIYEPTSGTVEVLGHRSALEVRPRIGYLPEEKGLYKKMKAREIIAYFGQLKGLRRGDALRRGDELLERYGLGEFKARRCEALSKGMQQKVQVLAAIVHAPEFVILDEPFSGLDPVNQQVMEQVIRDLRDNGATVVFSTHVMEHAERLCDRIVLIARGKKLLDGTIAEAKRSVPRRVLIETSSDVGRLRDVPGVVSLERYEGDGNWQITLAEGANADAVLRACFQHGIELRTFDRREPGLRDVFLKFVGARDVVEEVVA
ncbi:MAG: ABC transporter ATP-binding protein [Planctomycetota bacterium]